MKIGSVRNFAHICSDGLLFLRFRVVSEVLRTLDSD